jgi:hypothetical protein
VGTLAVALLLPRGAAAGEEEPAEAEEDVKELVGGSVN